MNSSFCAVTTDWKSRWPHGKEAQSRGADSNGVDVFIHISAVSECVLVRLLHLITCRGLIQQYLTESCTDHRAHSSANGVYTVIIDGKGFEVRYVGRTCVLSHFVIPVVGFVITSITLCNKTAVALCMRPSSHFIRNRAVALCNNVNHTL